MTIQLHNTLTQKKEIFTPLQSGQVSMYHCGPTAYDYAHIGNLRSYVFADILRRMFEAEGFFVRQIINITDVGHLSSDADSGEDKMTKALRREGKPMTLEAMRETAHFYADRFKDDLALLNIRTTDTVFPYASEHIKEDIELIAALEKKGFVYKTHDGLYFETSKVPHYPKLGKSAQRNNSRTRIPKNFEKKNPIDFALWKFNSTLGWECPWGKGFPGWHLECSAMSRKYLGQPFDIHTGGIDHISIHHNNEIAQSECAYDLPLAHYWLHNEFVTITRGKMAKSKGNSLTLTALCEKGFSPLAYRYWLLTAHYRTAVSFNFEALEAAENTYRGLISKMANFPEHGKVNETYHSRFRECVTDDLNTPQAIALCFEVLKNTDLSEADRRSTILSFDRALGLQLHEQILRVEKKPKHIPENVKKLFEAREAARRRKDWKEADALREKIQELGFTVKDGLEESFLDIR